MLVELGIVVVIAAFWGMMNLNFIAALIKVARTTQKIDLTIRHRAVVMVGGDFARSPRMQYHAVSLVTSNHYHIISLVGVDDGNKLCEALQPHQAPREGVVIEKRGLLRLGDRKGILGAVMAIAEKCPVKPLRWVLVTICRVAIFMGYFGLELHRVMSSSLDISKPVQATTSKAPRLFVNLTIPQLVMCQTPPAVPFVVLVKVLRCVVLLLAVWPLRFAVVPLVNQFFVTNNEQSATLARIASSIRSPQVIVDWHNFGFTLLQVDHRPHVIVAIYKFFERYFCCGDVNLTVSRAMQRALTTKNGNQRIGPFMLSTPVHVLYDTAPAFFSHVNRQKAIQQLRLGTTNSVITNVPSWFICPNSELSKKGLLIVSSTSWGSDDDYGMVVGALKRLDQHLSADGRSVLKNVWLVVTGKGPTRQRFEDTVAAAQLSPAVTVSTVYFQSFLDYSTMLGAGDIGLSVHFSSSGLDLPMKCVDMLGAGLPVAAIAYECIEELVTEKSGWLFRDELALFDLLLSCLTESGQESVRKKAVYVAEHRELWEESWDRVVKPLLA